MSKKERFSEVVIHLLQSSPIQFRGVMLSLSKPYLQQMENEQVEKFLEITKKMITYIENEDVEEGEEDECEILKKENTFL